MTSPGQYLKSTAQANHRDLNYYHLQ